MVNLIYAVLFKSFDVDNTGYITQSQLEALIASVSAQVDPENPEKFSAMGVSGNYSYFN